ncbi:MAG: DUF1583 domain-containing protein [Isosphaeraceae bacterium]
MSRHRGWAVGLACVGVFLLLEPGVSAQRTSARRGSSEDPAAAQEARERRAMERFLSLVEKNPRRGTALDRVYGYHVERGSLDAFIKSYRDRLAKNPADGTADMILGLLEFQRGQDAAAVAALRLAESARPQDPLPSYYLGQALVLVGQPDQAAEAFERALKRKPARNDLLEIFQALGRVYQRTQKPDQALAVWARLEALFPDDTRVKEQIASTLAEEDQPAQALPRFEALARSSKDPFRQVQLAIQAAELKVRLGKTDEALRDFEAMLDKLRPDSWLHKEVRRKIEEVFLRNDDRAGLVTYYERWTKREPEDVEGLVRLARALAAMGRIAEAQPWYEKAIKLAPHRRDLRLALIAQLAQEQKYAEAAAQYEQLDRSEPNNPDTLRDWGALVMRDANRPLAERRAAAAAVWRKLLETKPDDPVTIAQVADLFRQIDLVDDALALYRKAIEKAPGNPQYREYIGEYLHQLKRPAEAMAEWSKMAEGPNRTARNLSRLAEVLSGFGYTKEGIPPMEEAVKLEKDDFDLRMKLAELLHRLERFDEADVHLVAAAGLAAKDEEKSAALDACVKNDQAAGRVAARIAEMQRDIQASKDREVSVDGWMRLARYLEADGRFPDAVRAADRAVRAEPRSVPAWALSARLREVAGNLGDAADALRRLAEVDRKNRAEYLTGIARLEARLGRVDAAIKAGRDLLAAAPGNPEHYEFFSQLCFQLGRTDEGLDALRRAVRVNANDPKIILTLAENLAGMYRTDEAIEMYWRAFDRAEDLDAKLGVVSRMTELYLQRNQFDRLLTRLQHHDRDARPDAGGAQQRDVALCTAQAYASSGDLGSARAQIEPLLASNARDTQLLSQLSKLAEEEGDLEAAARYQKQLNELAATDEGTSRLAGLYARYGELEEAQAVWSKMAADKGESQHRVLQAIDSLLGHHKPGPVAEITAAMVRKEPEDWEALYRQGTSLAALDRTDQAAAAFRKLLDLRISDDEKSAIIKARTRDPKLQGQGARASSISRKATMPLEDRLGAALEIRSASGLTVGYYATLNNAGAGAWAPQDFGQARMAALGWLVSLAEKKGPSGSKQVIAAFRKAAGHNPPDAQALWDWFYLCAMRFDNAGAFAAARDLVRTTPTDPLAHWAYLYTLGGRHLGLGMRYYNYSSRNEVAHALPLDGEELDRVLASYRSLRTRRPELAQAQILQNVSDELKRAKRTADEETFYRDALANSQQFAQVAGAFTLAARRGDADGLCQLVDRYERLQAGRRMSYYYTGSYYFAGPGPSLSEGMSVCADRKAYDDVLRILDHELATIRRRFEHQSPGAAARANRAMMASNGPGYVPQYQVWVGKTARYVRVPFPLPNEYVDETAIEVLRSAFEIYKRNDVVSDLVDHFRRQAESASTPADAAYPRLCASYVLLWNDDKDEAIAEFTKVAHASRPESSLRIELAELLEQQGEPDDALAAADAVQPMDNATMRRREELALRVAVLTGNLDRARKAAERLFGLRLDTDTQVQLSSQMHQLGLHELAEAMLGRARRRAGNKAAALVSLMLQYQRQEKLDIAVQVAMQILHSTTGARQSNPNVYNPDNPDAARLAAIGVLSRSGRLDQLIDKAKEQLKKTPNSVQLHQTLADYYKAANRRDEARAELAAMVKLRPDDLTMRLQIAEQLVQDGQAAAAIEHYKAILKKDPSVVSRTFYRIPGAFKQAGQSEDLLAMFETLDLRQVGHPYYIIDAVQKFLADDKFRDRAMPLLGKIWDSFPEYHNYVFSYLRGDAIWKYPEVYRYALESIVPRPETFAPGMQWEAFDQILSYSSDGRLKTVMSKVLDLAASQGRLDELSAQVDAAQKAMPHWRTGRVVRALVDGRLGRFDRTKELIAGFLDETREEPLTTTVYSTIAAELEDHAATRDLAMQVYACGVYRPCTDTYNRLDFDSGCARRLVTIYMREDRPEDARRILVDMVRNTDDIQGYNAEYLQQMYLMGWSQVANKLAELGFAADAVAAYSEALAIDREIPASASNYIGDREQIAHRCREGISRTLDGLKDDELKATLDRLVASGKSGATRSGPGASQAPPTAAAGQAKPREPEQAVDLMVLVHPRLLDRARVRSLVAESIGVPGKEPVAPERLRQIETTAKTLESLRKNHADDLSLAIAEALVALGLPDPSRIDPALQRLETLVERNPLEALPSGARANSRQRAQAARQIPLWLVARACRQRDPASKRLREAADHLEARAFDAARRQADNITLMAMYREQGERALAAGDRRAAEAVWTRMLDTVVSPPKRRTAKPEEATPAALAPSVIRRSVIPVRTAATGTVRAVRQVAYQAATKTQAATPKARAAAANRARANAASGLPILTLDRFEQAMQIARLAAERDLTELNLRAVRESLQAGPPVVPTSTAAEARALRLAQRGIDEGSTDPVAPKVLSNLVELEQIWEEHHAAPQGVYEVLKIAVLPPGRPTEIFLYAPPPNPRALRRMRSAGAMLAAWAVRAGKVDELKQAIDARKRQPLAELPATILTVQLALASGDDAGATAALRTLAERLKKDSLRTTAELACHAALPAIDRPRPEVAKEALAVLDGCTKGFETNYQPEPLGSLLILLAREQSKRGDAAGVRKRLDAYTEAMEKNASRYSGDYSLYVRRQYLQRVASEFARESLWTDSLTALGRYADAPAYSGGDPPITDALARLTRRFAAATPAAARYKALHDWTMPTRDRRSVRILAAIGTRDLAPSTFTHAGAKDRSENGADAHSAEDSILSTAALLIDAARQAGTLEALADEARAAAEQKIENAETLHILVELARGRGTAVVPRLESRLAELLKQNRERERDRAKAGNATGSTASNSQNFVKFPWNDALAARAALASSNRAVAELGRRLTLALIDRAEKTGDYPVLAALRADLAAFAARRSGGTGLAGAPLPSAWHAADVRPGGELAVNGTPAVWAAGERYIAHPAGSAADLLVFDVPLTGTYELSVDAYVGTGASSAVVHDGLCFLPAQAGAGGKVYTVGQGETIDIPWKLSRADGFDRLTIQAAPGKVRYLVNGHLFYEDDDPSPTSPWLGLATHLTRTSAWRNLTLSGSPDIPREVHLTHGDRLEGWVSSFYGESQPSRRTDQVVDAYGNITLAAGAPRRRPRGSNRVKRPRPTVNVDEYDWAAKDGIIHGRRKLPDPTAVNYDDASSLSGVAEAEQSRLYYHRPLGDGEVVTYEFLYEPGQVMVHPAVDRVAFLIEPGGVRLHWMTTGGTDLSGLPADHAIDDPASRRGPAALPLKAGEWNAVKLAIAGGKVAIELNGQPVLERAIEPTLGRQFGLFHYRDQTSAQVRNVVLRGHWPASVPDRLRSDLATVEPGPDVGESARRTAHAIIGERLLALQAGEVVEQARRLEPAKRYDALAAWVLPGPDHPFVRLEGDFTPTFPTSTGDLGGEPRSPAIELVSTAKELGRLDDLANSVRELKAGGDEPMAASRRGRRAILALVATARGDDATAGESIEALHNALKQRPLDVEDWARWPELAAAGTAIERDSLKAKALSLADLAADQARKSGEEEESPSAKPRVWEAQVRHLRDRLAGPDGTIFGRKPADSFLPQPAGMPWRPVTQTTARSRGEGSPLPGWVWKDGNVRHLPGHADDMLYLPVPMRGKFEVNCELTAPKGREIRLVYGGQVFGLKPDGKSLERGQIGRPMPNAGINPPLEKLGDWYALRLAVDANRLRVSINGRQVHDAPLPAECDPWLAILCPADQAGEARKITITGKPQIPDRLSLTALPDMSGWRTDEYGETTSGDNADWEKRGDEVFGRLAEDIPVARQESVLRYHRPMLEDGRISYEFYYEPGKAMVHPSLDRLAFLVEPEGVRIHRLTDGAYERSGLAADNMADEPANRRGPASPPLKPKAWNRMVVQTKGDRVLLELNGQAIFERTLEPNNRRAFGLFHFADATQARARDLTYQGDWPRTVPAGLGQ